MDKRIDGFERVPPIEPVQRTTPINSYRSGHNPVKPYNITDRVTISAVGKRMSQKYADVITDGSSSPILSYEIRKPFITTPYPTAIHQPD